MRFSNFAHPIGEWLRVTLLATLVLGASPSIWANSYEDARQAFELQQFAEAIEIALPLAEAGDQDAQFLLGWMYDGGTGTERDDQAALTWYQAAAEQGHPVAQFNLALMYDNGNGTGNYDQQKQKAVQWYTAAAEQNYTRAQYNLAIMYEDGEGVEQKMVIPVRRRHLHIYSTAAEVEPSISRKPYIGIPRRLSKAMLWRNLI